jgi:beta-lactamase regulating signal transducer with metallopeptidase domain
VFDRLAGVSIQTAMLVVIVFGLSRWSALSARVRAGLWALVFVHALGGLMFTVRVPVFSAPSTPTARLMTVVPGGPAMPAAPGARGEGGFVFDAKGAVIAVWALGAALLFFSQLRIERSARRALANSRSADGTVAVLAREVADEMGLGRFRVRLAPDLGAPCVSGLLHPTVYLPASLEGADREQLRAVLVHELAHVRHADLPVSILAALARCLFFFHPMTWIAHREWAIHREAACDAEVLRRSTIGKTAYCRMLIQFAKGRPMLAATIQAATEGFSHLHRRICEMKNTQPKKRGAAPVATFAALIITALAALPVTLTARQASTQHATPKGKPQVTYQTFTPEQIAAAEAMRVNAIRARDLAMQNLPPEMSAPPAITPEPTPSRGDSKPQEKEKLKPTAPMPPAGIPGGPAPIFGSQDNPNIPTGVYIVMPPAGKLPADWLTKASVPKEPGVYEVIITKDEKAEKGVTFTFHKMNATVSGG